MQKIYKDRIWQLHKEKEIGFTYRSQFERSLNELPEELQALIISKVWNDGREGISAYVLGATRHRGYHYKQEGLLYNLYVKKVFLPLYGGLNGSVGTQDLEQKQNHETRKEELKSNWSSISNQVKYECIEASELREPAKIMTPKHPQQCTWLTMRTHLAREVHHLPPGNKKQNGGMWSACTPEKTP